LPGTVQPDCRRVGAKRLRNASRQSCAELRVPDDLAERGFISQVDGRGDEPAKLSWFSHRSRKTDAGRFLCCSAATHTWQAITIAGRLNSPCMTTASTMVLGGRQVASSPLRQILARSSDAPLSAWVGGVAAVGNISRWPTGWESAKGLRRPAYISNQDTIAIRAGLLRTKGWFERRARRVLDDRMFNNVPGRDRRRGERRLFCRATRFAAASNSTTGSGRLKRVGVFCSAGWNDRI